MPLGLVFPIICDASLYRGDSEIASQKEVRIRPSSDTSLPLWPESRPGMKQVSGRPDSDTTPAPDFPSFHFSSAQGPGSRQLHAPQHRPAHPILLAAPSNSVPNCSRGPALVLRPRPCPAPCSRPPPPAAAGAGRWALLSPQRRARPDAPAARRAGPRTALPRGGCRGLAAPGLVRREKAP